MKIRNTCLPDSIRVVSRNRSPVIQAFLVIVLIFGFIVVDADQSLAQRSRKNKNKDPETVTELSEEERRLTDQLFTEGEKYYILDDFTKALAFFQKALELDPDNAAIHYKIADIYNSNSELDSALPHAIRAVELSPDNKYYYILLADIYTSSSDFANATEVYETLIDKIPGNEEYLFQTAALYIYQEKLDEALRCYDQIEDKFGINDQITYQKQNILIKQGKLDEVIAEGNKLIEAFPGEPDYVIDLANKMINNEKNKEAELLLTKALIVFPDNPMIRYKLAQVYQNTGKHSEAKEIITGIFDNSDFSLQKKMQIVAGYFGKKLSEEEKTYVLELSKKIIEYHPDEADAYALLGDLFQSYDSLEAARNVYLKALAINPANLQAWQNVLDYEIRNNQSDSVVAHVEAALTVFPNQPLLYFYGGNAYLIEKNAKKAVQLLEQGKRLSSSNLQLLLVFNSLLGDAYHEIGDYKQSDEAYEAALDFDPENDHVLNNYSYFLSLRKEKLDLAFEMSECVVKRNPDDPTYLDTHAWVLYMMGRYEEAREIIEKAIKQEENVSGTIIEHYGDILFKLGDTNKAVEQWEKAREMNVESELIDQKIADRKLYE